jgi:hypothetical protein
MASKRGGARPGAGRKKVAEKAKSAIEQARQKVVDKLPAIVDALIRSALEGDTKAGIHLLDRGMGKVVQALEHSGPEGGPLKVLVEYADDLAATAEAAPGPATDPPGDAAV